MKLTELEPVFIGKYAVNGGRAGYYYYEFPSIDGAQGVMFTCPGCGGHQILVWFKNPRGAQPVPADAEPGPYRGTVTGDSFDNLTLTPSIDLSKVDDQHPRHPGRCYWHGHVTDGQISNAS